MASFSHHNYFDPDFFNKIGATPPLVRGPLPARPWYGPARVLNWCCCPDAVEFFRPLGCDGLEVQKGLSPDRPGAGAGWRT
jgi:hypothetical protein